MKKIIIAAIAQNGVIGRSNGEMPWHVKEEFKHFKKTTTGFPIIMGRKSFDSLGEPLPNRLNVILTHNKDYKAKYDNVLIFNNLVDSLDYFSNQNYEKIFIIGGGIIFNEAIELCDEMILSFMKFNANGDVHFPKISDNWVVTSEEEHEEFVIKRYQKRKLD